METETSTETMTETSIETSTEASTKASTKASTEAASSDQTFTANLCADDETQAMRVEDITEMKTVFACGKDSNHSNHSNYSTAMADDTLSPDTSPNTPSPQVQLQQGGAVSCHLCNRVYKNKGSLATHLRVRHKQSVTTHSKMPCLEEGCDYRGSRIARLMTHLIQEHQMKFQCEKVTFQNKEDFWKWRKEAEERCHSSYCARTSAKTMVSGEMKFFLWCRRSGYDKYHSRVAVRGGQRKRSVKINAVCTSFMEVTFDTAGGATVHFCRTHYGHADDGQHLRLNAEERDSIRQLIQEGHGASSIITTMKTQMPQHRHHLLKYGNIRGIYIRQTQGSGLAESDQETFQDAVVVGDQNSLTSPLRQSHDTDMAESDQETFEDAVMNGGQNSLTSPLQQPHSTGVVEGGQVIYQNVVMGIGSQNSLTYSLQQSQCTGIVEGGQVMYQNAVVNEGDQDSLTLEVEKEVEVEAIDRQPPDASEILDLDQLQTCSMESLQAEVKGKIERAFHLASYVTNEETLKYVSENLDHLTDLLEKSRGIEVVSEASKPLLSQDTGQNVVLHKDIDGNTHLLLCSSESIDNLMCKEKGAA